MKIHQIILSETTTAGAVATVAKPMGETQKRPSVRGLEPAEKVMFGKTKKKGPYANSLSEGKVKELSMDLKGGKDGLTDVEFKKKYGKTKEEMRKAMQQKPEPVKEAKLDEDDVIIVPGQGMKRKTGFVPHGQSRVDHEVEMARSDVLATMKNAKAIYELLKDKSEDEGIEGWVQEKLIKANDYLNSVKEYYDEKMMSNEMAGGVIAAGGVGEARVPQLPTRGADYSKYDTDHLEMLLRPGILHRNELGFKKLIRKELERRRQAQPVVAKSMEGQVVFSGTGADGGKYEIIQTGPTDFMIHANGKHIDTYSSLQRAMSVLKNEVSGLKKGVAEGAKVDRMVGHIKKSEIKTGKSKDEAENIAWATVNKRGYLDNKNKKKGK